MVALLIFKMNGKKSKLESAHDTTEFGQERERVFEFPRTQFEVLKHCQRHNGPSTLSPKLELFLKAEKSGNYNLVILLVLLSLKV